MLPVVNVKVPETLFVPRKRWTRNRQVRDRARLLERIRPRDIDVPRPPG